MKLQKESTRNSQGLIPPHGGELKDLMIKDERVRDELISNVSMEIECSDRNACDVELLMIGAFSPLEGFMDEKNYKSVITNNRDSSGNLFGLQRNAGRYPGNH